MIEFLQAAYPILGWLALGAVIAFTAIFCVLFHGGIYLIPPVVELTADEERMVLEEKLLELAKPQWPKRRVG